MGFFQRALFIFILVICSQLQAGGKPEDIQALRDLLQPITSLSASFKQRITDAEGFELDTSEGLFQVAQPAKLHWHISQPLPQQIISDGQTLWLYDPDLEQVIIQPFNPAIGATPAILFSGDLEQLASSYVVSRLDGNRFKLIPEQAGSMINSMQITFVEQRPVSIAFTDNLEQITTVTFTDLDINPDIPADRFVFKIPPGIDVINNAN
jgi:outer membrane lipoprotein carrier protein